MCAGSGRAGGELEHPQQDAVTVQPERGYFTRVTYAMIFCFDSKSDLAAIASS